jgi:hypothetical protein
MTHCELLYRHTDKHPGHAEQKKIDTKEYMTDASVNNEILDQAKLICSNRKQISICPG